MTLFWFALDIRLQRLHFLSFSAYLCYLYFFSYVYSYLVGLAWPTVHFGPTLIGCAIDANFNMLSILLLLSISNGSNRTNYACLAFCEDDQKIKSDAELQIVWLLFIASSLGLIVLQLLLKLPSPASVTNKPLVYWHFITWSMYRFPKRVLSRVDALSCVRVMVVGLCIGRSRGRLSMIFIRVALIRESIALLLVIGKNRIHDGNLKREDISEWS